MYKYNESVVIQFGTIPFNNYNDHNCLNSLIYTFIRWQRNGIIIQ